MKKAMKNTVGLLLLLATHFSIQANELPACKNETKGKAIYSHEIAASESNDAGTLSFWRRSCSTGDANDDRLFSRMQLIASFTPKVPGQSKLTHPLAEKLFLGQGDYLVSVKLTPLMNNPDSSEPLTAVIYDNVEQQGDINLSLPFYLESDSLVCIPSSPCESPDWSPFLFEFGAFRPDDSPDSISNVSGTWYDPASSGLGFNVIHTDREQLLAYFYGYKADADGDALWLMTDALPVDEVIKGETYRLPVFSGYEGNGASFNTAPTDGNFGITEWGTLEMVFNTCNSATAILTGADGTMRFELIKLANLNANPCQEL